MLVRFFQDFETTEICNPLKVISFSSSLIRYDGYYLSPIHTLFMQLFGQTHQVSIIENLLNYHFNTLDYMKDKS